MAKPTKGNKTKRANSDESRLKLVYIKALKRKVAIVKSTFEVPEGFKFSKISNSRIRIKGVGAQAIKLVSNRYRDDVIEAVEQRNWNRVMTLVPNEGNLPMNYTSKSR